MDPTGTETIVSYWPIAAVVAVLVIVLLLPVRSLMRRAAAPVPAAVPEPPPPPPTPVQRLAAELEKVAREKGTVAAPKAPVVPLAVPPPPRPSAWTAREIIPQAPEPAPAPIAVTAERKPQPQKAPAPRRGFQAFGKPPGLAAPRPGGRDDLKMIRGIGPRIERGLNALGVFHYDQIAAWDRRAVVWVETWFSLKGCVTRERWVQQARELVDEDAPLRQVRG